MILNQYIKLFSDISYAHKQTKFFGFGPIHEYLDTNVNTELGSHLWLEIDKSNITKGVLVDSFTLYCMDYVNKDITNRNDVLSDTKRILEDVIALLYNPVYADLFELDENSQLDVFYDEQNAGEACGWKTNISLKQDFLYDSCQIPLDGIPVGEGGYVVPTNWSPDVFFADILGSPYDNTALAAALAAAGSNQTLAQTLAIGNSTGGDDINVDANDSTVYGSKSAIYYDALSGWTIFSHLLTGEYLKLPDSGGIELSSIPSNIQTALNAKQNSLGYTAENSANKTSTVVGNETSTTLFLTVKGYYDYLIGVVWLTAQIFGTWINGLTSKSNPVDADYIPLMDSADTDKTKKLSWANIKTVLFTNPILQNSSSSTSAGAIGYDGLCFYANIGDNNKAIISTKIFMRQHATYTLTSTTSAQKIFNGSTNGRVTLPIGTYKVTGQLYLSSMSATSGNAKPMFENGTGTVANFLGAAFGTDANPLTATFNGSQSASAPAGTGFPASVVTASAATSMIVTIIGTLEVSGAGTVIPSISLVTAASAVVGVGSFMEFELLGLNTVTSAGAWD